MNTLDFFMISSFIALAGSEQSVSFYALFTAGKLKAKISVSVSIYSPVFLGSQTLSLLLYRIHRKTMLLVKLPLCVLLVILPLCVYIVGTALSGTGSATQRLGSQQGAAKRTQRRRRRQRQPHRTPQKKTETTVAAGARLAAWWAAY